MLKNADPAASDFREIAFSRYISYGFGEQHSADVEALSRHYAFNYLRFLPQAKDAAILDIGCGMGDFLYFLQKHGYTNFLGLDVGEEQVEYTNNVLGDEKAIRVASTEDFLAKGGRYASIVILTSSSMSKRRRSSLCCRQSTRP